MVAVPPEKIEAHEGIDPTAIDPTKIRQRRIAEILPKKMRDCGVDAWLTFTREGTLDALGWDVAAQKVVGRAACLFALRDGKLHRIAIAASYDVTGFRESGLYDEVVAYRSEGLGAHLRDRINALSPDRIALNFSRDVPNADGITLGMYRYLIEILGPQAESRITSSERLVISLKGVKFPEEIAAIERAAIWTQRMLREALSRTAIAPGVTVEKDVAAFLDRRTHELGFKPSFVSVMVGPDRGHADPTDRVIRHGDLLRTDFGVSLHGYSSDIQRTAYLLRPRETDAPAAVRKVWRTTLAANRAAVAAMKPGVMANAVDVAARAVITGAGYAEYPHAAGHEIGLKVHDVGPVLGPDWKERYGTAVWHPIEEGQVFAVEPMIYSDIPEVGGVVQVGLEEDVAVESHGARYFGEPQEELWLLEP